MIHSTASLLLIKEELALAAQCYKNSGDEIIKHGFRSRIKVLSRIYRMMLKDNCSEIERMYISMAGN